MMSQLMRQVGVVIGLTVILTFPVTVVSGAGSRKQSDIEAQLAAVGGTVRMQGATAGAEPEKAWLVRQEPRR